MVKKIVIFDAMNTATDANTIPKIYILFLFTIIAPFGVNYFCNVYKNDIQINGKGESAHLGSGTSGHWSEHFFFAHSIYIYI